MAPAGSCIQGSNGFISTMDPLAAILPTEVSEARSRQMRAVRSSNTGIEMAVRRVAHALGYRYRLHRRDLPGKPDLVFPTRHKVIFVHGCFWHQHDCRHGRRKPRTRTDYWLPKLQGNVRRDRDHEGRLRELGWDILVLWECQIKDRHRLQRRLREFLGNPGATDKQRG